MKPGLSRPVSVFDHRPEVSVFDLQILQTTVCGSNTDTGFSRPVAVFFSNTATGLDNPGFKWLPNIHCKSGVLPVI